MTGVVLSVLFVAGVFGVVIWQVLTNLIYICGPNEVLVFSGGKHGRRGYRINHPGDSEAGDAEIAEAEAAIQRDGFIILWSNVLDDLVAYTRSDEDRAKVPAGIVTYSMTESPTYVDFFYLST